MNSDDFFSKPFHGNEVEKFRYLLEAFDRAFSYTSGFNAENMNHYRAAWSSMDVQLMELLRLVMQQDNFEALARRSDDKIRSISKD